jgi:acetyltransferase-like isoleucine patch superfamily enzyme
VVTRDVPPGALAKGVPAKIEEDWLAKREDGGDAESGSA